MTKQKIGSFHRPNIMTGSEGIGYSLFSLLINPAQAKGKKISKLILISY